MKQLYKICNNPDCGQVLGCMPKYKECKFCKGVTYDTVKGESHPYYNPYGDVARIGIIYYLGSHCHIIHGPERTFDMYVMANNDDLERCF